MLGREFCAYYLRELDLAALTMGSAANVPGTFVQYDAASDVLILEDIQYTEWWSVGAQPRECLVGMRQGP